MNKLPFGYRLLKDNETIVNGDLFNSNVSNWSEVTSPYYVNYSDPK